MPSAVKTWDVTSPVESQPVNVRVSTVAPPKNAHRSFAKHTVRPIGSTKASSSVTSRKLSPSGIGYVWAVSKSGGPRAVVSPAITSASGWPNTNGSTPVAARVSPVSEAGGAGVVGAVVVPGVVVGDPATVVVVDASIVVLVAGDDSATEVVVGAVVLVGVVDEVVESALSVGSRLQAPATSTSPASAAMAGEVTMLRVDMSDKVSSRPRSRRGTYRVRTCGRIEISQMAAVQIAPEMTMVVLTDVTLTSPNSIKAPIGKAPF